MSYMDINRARTQCSDTTAFVAYTVSRGVIQQVFVTQASNTLALHILTECYMDEYFGPRI